MAEEMTNSVETVPVEAEPAQAAPAAPPATVPEAVLTAALSAPPATPETKQKSSPLLVFLTVLLILVGIIDAMLWGVAGYYLLQKNVQIGTGGGAAQSASSGGAPAQGGSGPDASSDDEAKREALEAYIREMVKIVDLETEVLASHNSVVAENYTDDAAVYAEFTGRTLSLCQQLVEKSSAISSDDPEIAELHKIYQDWANLLLDSITTMISAIDNQDQAGSDEYEKLRNEASQLENRYKQGLQTLAKERGVSLG